MHGNVFEYGHDIVNDPDGFLRPLHGCFWNDPARLGRAGRRGLGTPEAQYIGGGLRLARVPVEANQ